MANTTDKSILTAAGKALLAQLNAEEKPLIIDKMIFANVPNRPEYPQPDDVVPTDHIVHQEQVEQRGRLSADSVIYSTTLTSGVGPFEFNWTGAYCSEYGVLVTIDHHALTPKTADQPGVAGNTLVRSVVLEYKDIAEITNITVDASSWQYNATPRMKKMDDDVAQAIIDQNGKDWFIEDGFLVTPQASAFNIKAGAGYVSGNRVTLEFDRNVQVPNKPSFIYVDAHREGTPTGEQVTLFDFVITAEEKDDYTDANDVKHFVCKIAQVLEDGSVSDLRPKRKDKINGFKLRGWPGNLLSAIEYSAASGAVLEVDDELATIESTSVVGLSGFNIFFYPNAKLKLAENQNKPLIKMHACREFSLLGDILLDGNKEKNGGLSSGTFADYFLLGIQECESFSLGNVTALNAHTGGIGIYACNDFNSGRLYSKGSRRIGVSVDGDLSKGKPTKNWSCVEMRGDESELDHGLRLANVDNFSLLSAMGLNNANNGVLFEKTCLNGTVTSVKTNGNGVNGGKAEETHNMTFGTIDADDNAMHGWAFINNNDSTTSLINAKGNGVSGLYLYSSEAKTPTKRNTIGVVKLSENDKGLFVEQQEAGSVVSVTIGTVDIQENNYGVYSEDIILDSEVKIGSGVIKNNVSFDVYAANKTQRPLFGDDVMIGSINYSTTLTMGLNDSSPTLKNSSKTFRTANTDNTFISQIIDPDAKDKMISIRVEDEFTHFTNGTGRGRVIVIGGTINPPVGSIVLAIKSTPEDGGSYYWNVRELK
ncbi:phage tail-collar fiber domain-containing protein [Vibrio vulnificus]|uniref:phage tail-collar fiber domain-containing protein n=1 Tax=Vibrio vulnificus TaxID=672 RepID=UPI001CCC13D1|nr:phage tail protein [Vibrio vulnificus]